MRKIKAVSALIGAVVLIVLLSMSGVYMRANEATALRTASQGVKRSYRFVTVKAHGVFLLSRCNFGKKFRLCEIPFGSCLLVTEDYGRYCAVTTGGSRPLTGYVLIDDIADVNEMPDMPFYRLEEAEVSATKTFLYSEPDDYSETKAILKKGERVSVYGRMSGSEEWFYVFYEGSFGYVKQEKATLCGVL